MLNTMMIQLYQPLNFMGMLYREIKQAVIDIEMMFGLLSREPEIEDAPNAKPLVVTSGRIFLFRETSPSPTSPTAKILKGLTFDVPAGHNRRGGRSLRRRQVDPLAAAVSLLRGDRRPHHDRRPGHP